VNQWAHVRAVVLDAGDPVVILAGSHIGCFELFGTDRVRSIRDLKGRPWRSARTRRR
jgi:hypothetical protein